MRTLGKTIAVAAVGIVVGVTAWRGAALKAQGTRRLEIQSISVCSPTGGAGQASCPSGSFDTQQLVLGTNGNSINRTAGFGPTPDEHSSVFAPGTLGTNQDYLFFLSTATAGNPGIGVTVLSGGAGPGKNGQWVVDIPKADGYGAYPSGFGQVFNTAMKGGVCPTVPDGNPAHQDQTFDQHYASAGSVMIDPTGAPASLLMIYEGTNACIGTTGGPVPDTVSDYISLAVATSTDYGKSWPTYRGTPTFDFVPLPDTNPTQAPNAPMGATGKNVCVGNNCTSTPPANYGRYVVITPTTSLASLMAAGKQLTGKFGEQEIAGFVDDVSGASAPYVYATFGDVREGRAQLNGGSAPLSFQKWDGRGFNAPGIGGAEPSVIPAGAFESCEAPAQSQFGASISYVEDTQQYLLTFVCISGNDPALGKGGAGNQGAAWFYSTSYDLSDPSQWSAPKEITGSWSEFDFSGDCESYQGWYPTLMTLGRKPAHLSTSGYVFYLWGCQGGGTPAPGRQFASRQFTITTALAPQVSIGGVANGASFQAGIVPNSWISILGTNLSSKTDNWGNAIVGGKLPTSLDGVGVSVGGQPAYIAYISPTQINAVAPNVGPGTVSVTVTNSSGTSSLFTAVAQMFQPAFFQWGSYAVATRQDFSLAVKNGTFSGLATVPAKPGDIIILWGTGFGPTTPAAPTGVEVPAGTTYYTANPVTITVGGVRATVYGTALSPGYAGLYQVGIQIPTSLANGDYSVIATVSGAQSPSSTLITVQK
jgi:uncharacterized protein (TIGR03437 family)